MLEQLKSRAGALKTEVYAVYLAAKDPRTPWYAKALVFVVVAHTFSPIDLIPDFIPVLGWLDDLIVTPGGLWLAIKLIPPGALEEARREAKGRGPGRGAGLAGAAMIVLFWLLILAGLTIFLLR